MSSARQVIIFGIFVVAWIAVTAVAVILLVNGSQTGAALLMLAIVAASTLVVGSVFWHARRHGRNPFAVRDS